MPGKLFFEIITVALFLLCFHFQPVQAQTPKPISLNWLNGTPKKESGVSWGVPWRQGEIKKATTFELIKADGSRQPVQTWDMAYWPDGSIKWTGLATVADSSSAALTLAVASSKTKSVTPASLQISNDPQSITINTGAVQCVLSKNGANIISSLKLRDDLIAQAGQLQCILQNGPDGNWETAPIRQKLTASIERVDLEQSGPVRAVVRIAGRFKNAAGGNPLFPFVTRMYFYAGVKNIRTVYTFFFDGDDKKDFIKGLGLSFSIPFREGVHNRHVRFGGEENGIWAEPVQPLNGRRPNQYTADQAAGKRIPNADAVPAQQPVYKEMASWNDYKLVQHSADGFNIQKRTNGASSWLDAVGGKRASGLLFAGDATGGLALSVKNFWQTYPAALEASDMKEPSAKMTAWLWSPYADAMDLRHYDTVSHDINLTYEDVQPGYSTPYGIGHTSELMICPYNAVPSNDDLADAAAQTANASLLVATPQYLHNAGAFGVWSLPDRSSKGRQWIEDQLDKAVAFYQGEIDRREWYGFWNYGDVMHSYDAARHSWKYDVGGFAWDNTELSTDVWLWYAFLRSGRADIFRMAEAMTRHTSEVDVYHLGPFAGLGSRHNVNHWGDGSKEVRESAAVLRRFYYYLTTDERTGDVMHEVAMTADSGLLHVDPLREILPPSRYPTHARFGPDWTALVGNWMTEWERTGDVKWKNKILVGVADFAGMPHGFYSGKGKDAGMGYDPRTNHFYQLDSGDIGSLHLATLMGGMETVYEVLPLLNSKDLARLYLQYCSLYGAPLEEVQAAFGKGVKGTLGELQGDYARQPAYVYSVTKDPKFAKRAWDAFLPNPQSPFNRGAKFDGALLKGPAVVKPFYEIRNVSTNSTAQWCLNAIELLQLAGEAMPEHNAVWDQ